MTPPIPTLLRARSAKLFGTKLLGTRLLGASLILASLTFTTSAHADKKGQALLQALDKKATAAKDQYFTYDMVIAEPGKSERKMEMEVWIKGHQRLVHFTAPGDVKGMKVLIRSRSQMYVYLKAFRKIRRITSHMKKQSIFGSDYNYDDQSTVTYADIFDGQFLKETKTANVVRAKARSGSDTPYGFIDLYLRKSDNLPMKLLYYNDAGKHIKTETRREYLCKKGVCNGRVMRMPDHTRNGHYTEIIRKKWKVNTGVSDRKFSRRALQRSY